MGFEGGKQDENREIIVIKEGRLKNPEIMRIDEDSAQGGFPDQAQVIRGEKWGGRPNKVEDVGKNGGVFLKMEKRSGRKPVA